MLGCWKPPSFRFQSTVGAEHMQEAHFPKNERVLFLSVIHTAVQDAKESERLFFLRCIVAVVVQHSTRQDFSQCPLDSIDGNSYFVQLFIITVNIDGSDNDVESIANMVVHQLDRFQPFVQVFRTAALVTVDDERRNYSAAEIIEHSARFRHYELYL